MDRFSEQLIERQGDKKASLYKGLVIAGTAVVVILLAVLLVWSQFTLSLLCLTASIGAVWLSMYLCKGFDIEYEYIVTNDDLDVDKIAGKRKRTRLISVDLKSVDEFAPYLNDTELNSDVTVLADDGTGYDLWYVFIETEKNGKIAIIFNPDERTRSTIVGGLNPALRAKCKAQFAELLETEEAEE